jgi:predicted PurR-regulated permease PerM
MNATLIIVFILGIIFSVGFVLLLMSVIPAINQFKNLLADLEKTSAEVRDLTGELKETNQKINRSMDDVEKMIGTSKETMETVWNSMKKINKSYLKNSAGFVAMLPAIKLGWKLVKKYKGGKNV